MSPTKPPSRLPRRPSATGAIDIVICNAGMMSSRGGIADAGHDAAEWQRVLTTNVAGAFLTARAFLPHLSAGQGRQARVHLVDDGVLDPGQRQRLAYRASKAAVANLGANLPSS